jgi:uridylate kinase
VVKLYKAMRTLGYLPKFLDRMAAEIGELVKLKIQVGMVIGGGNLFRGHSLSKAGLGRISADYMGMLGTVMNSIAMRDALERAGFACRVMSAIPMTGVVDHYDRRKAIHHLDCGRVVIFCAGTGNPLFTTDSAASLRAIEMNADVLLKATNVNGIYTADPAKDPQAKLYERITFSKVLEQELGVMDLTAFSQCRDHKMPIRVFNINHAGALLRICYGDNEGTLVEQG